MNNGFKKIMQQQFIQKLIKAGIDPNTVDLSTYDFESFSGVNDLIQYYASLGDPICLKILNSEYKFVDDYINYLESKLQEYNRLQEYNSEAEKEDLDLEERLKRLEEMLENKIINRSEWIDRKFENKYSELEKELSELKREKNTIINKTIEAIKRDIKNEIERVWDYKFRGLQSCLEQFVDERLKIKPEIKLNEERLNKLEEKLNVIEEMMRSVDLEKLERKIDEKLKGLEEVITYGTKRALDTYEELRRSHEELMEKYLDLASKYEGIIDFIEKVSFEVRQKRDYEKTKKIGAQIAKGIFLGLICVPLIPFLPLLYGQVYAKVYAKAGRKEKQSLLAYLGL